MEICQKSSEELAPDEIQGILDLFNNMSFENREKIWSDGEFKEEYFKIAKRFYLAKEGGKIVACLFTTTDSIDATCITIFVEETCRRRHIGKDLVVLAKFMETDRLYAKVRKDNISSRKLFESCGFLKDDGIYFFDQTYLED